MTPPLAAVRRRLAPTLLVCLAAACASPGTLPPPRLGTASGSCPSGGLAPGQHLLQLEVGGRTRLFRLRVPSAGARGEPLPLVVNFHGYTSSASAQARYTGMEDAAERDGFLAAHPEATGRPSGWNAGPCCGAAAADGVDDVGFARALVEEVAARACVDEARVYATGFSNGGFLSHRLACEAADVFAAVAPVSGALLLPAGECRPSRPVPLLHVHGTRDDTVGYAGGGRVASFPDVPGVLAAWAARNGCAAEPRQTLAQGAVRCVAWEACREGAEVALCTVEGGTHTWPGSFNGTRDLDATDAAWRFLSRFRKP
jgi:polyhydroxybutyrate depolymerase